MMVDSQGYAYVTKWALTTRGITRERIVRVKGTTIWIAPIRFGLDIPLGRLHWHETFAQAKARAEDMRAERDVSLQAQLARVRALEFTEPGIG